MRNNPSTRGPIHRQKQNKENPSTSLNAAILKHNKKKSSRGIFFNRRQMSEHVAHFFPCHFSYSPRLASNRVAVSSGKSEQKMYLL